MMGVNRSGRGGEKQNKRETKVGCHELFRLEKGKWKIARALVTLWFRHLQVEESKRVFRTCPSAA